MRAHILKQGEKERERERERERELWWLGLITQLLFSIIGYVEIVAICEVHTYNVHNHVEQEEEDLDLIGGTTYMNIGKIYKDR